MRPPVHLWCFDLFKKVVENLCGRIVDVVCSLNDL